MILESIGSALNAVTSSDTPAGSTDSSLKLTQSRNMSMKYHGNHFGQNAPTQSHHHRARADSNNAIMTTANMEFPCMEASRCFLTEKEHGQRLTLSVSQPSPLANMENPFAFFFSKDSQSKQPKPKPKKPISTLGFTKQRSKSEMWYVKFDTVAIPNLEGANTTSKRRISSTSSTSSMSLSMDIIHDDDDYVFGDDYSHDDSNTTTTENNNEVIASSTEEHDETKPKAQQRSSASNANRPQRSSSTGSVTTRLARVVQFCHCTTGLYLSSNRYGRTKATSKSKDGSNWWIMEPASITSATVTASSSSPIASSSPTHATNSDTCGDRSNTIQYVLRSKSNPTRYLKYNTTGISTRNSASISSGAIVVDDMANNESDNNNFEDEYNYGFDVDVEGQSIEMSVGMGGEIIQTTKDLEKAAIWELEFISGELCVISNPVVHCQMRCNPLGHLNLSTYFKGWEIFRFIEIGDGSVAISSWTHSTKYLSSDPDGNVQMTDNSRLGYWERWKIEKSNDGHGLFIGSVAHFGRYLSISNFTNTPNIGSGGSGGNGNDDYSQIQNNHFTNLFEQQQNVFHTTTKPGEFAKWHIDPAHQHTYYLKSVVGVPDSDPTKNNIQVARSGNDDPNNNNENAQTPNNEFLYLSSNRHGRAFISKHRRDWEEWKMDRTFDGCVTLFSIVHQTFLGSNASGNILTTTSKGDWSIWEMEESPYGGIFLKSKSNHRILSIRGGGTVEGGDVTSYLCTISGDQHTEQETWVLEPRLPPSLSGNKILALSAAGIAGAALTVAMPFAVLGAVEAAGVAATEVSLLAAGGAFTAEAALATAGASLVVGGVAVGTTAAIAKDPQELSDGMPAPVELKEDYLSLGSKRPISAWRHWT